MGGRSCRDLALGLFDRIGDRAADVVAESVHRGVGAFHVLGERGVGLIEGEASGFSPKKVVELPLVAAYAAQSQQTWEQCTRNLYEADVARLVGEREKLMEISNMLRADLNRVVSDGFRAGGAASAPPAARWPPAPVEVGGGGGAVRSLGDAFESEAVSVAGAFLKD